jgi:hypothetical protein
MSSCSDLLVDIFAFSGCFWGLYGLYVSIRIQRFIVKRYEQETGLLDTVFFREHAILTRYIPDFFSSAMYSSHLLMCLWGWWLYARKKMFRDSEGPFFDTQHFSQKEARLVKWFAISCLIAALHGVASLQFRSIWPQIFR